MSPTTAAAIIRLGQYVRSARTEGMSASEADFARKIGCTQAELRQLESGDATTPVGVLIAALNALQVLPAVVDAANPNSFILASKPVAWPEDALKS